MFKDKTKELFEKWYNKEYISFGMQFYNPISEEPEIVTLDFCDYPFVFQQGVLLKFLREQGIEVNVSYFIRESKISGYLYSIMDMDIDEEIENSICKDHDTALKLAITKAGELLNERSGK